MYIVDRSSQDQLLSVLVPMESSAATSVHGYRDPRTGEHWTLYHALSRHPGRGPRLLRQEHPGLALADRLEMCFASGRRDDLIGLAWDLSETPEDWPPMIEWLERRTDLPPEQVELFLGNITVVGAVNRRPVAGRQVGDVMSEFRRYSRLAERARGLVRPGAGTPPRPQADGQEAGRS